MSLVSFRHRLIADGHVGRRGCQLIVPKSFSLWSLTDTDPYDPVIADGTPSEPVSIVSVPKYLAAVRSWHLVAQGWPPPLSDAGLAQLNRA